MSSGTAIILEDSRVQAQIISKMITELGWQCFICHDHESLFALTQTCYADLLLLDIYIEKGNTLYIIPELREMAPNVPIAVMSGGGGALAMPRTVSDAKKAKVDYMLPKPFTEMDLNKVLVQCARVTPNLAKRGHIVVVDDSTTQCTIVKKALTNALFKVSTHHSMEDALLRDDFESVTMIMIDIFMPGLGGIAGIQRLRKEYPQLPIIAMSAGLSGVMNKHEALFAAQKLGARAILPKPFLDSDLVELVEHLLTEIHDAEKFGVARG